MHQRILLRARKGPFDVVTPEETFERNWIGDNSGNLVFSHAAYKLLATSTAKITPSRWFRADPRTAAEINEKYDVFVIPLANAFRRSYAHRLESMTRLIERLKIPVVVFGVGVQTNVDGDRDYLRPIDEPVRAFCRAVLDRSHSIGVRGEVTEDYLRTLGFSAVEQIGCPSMFLHGDSLRIDKPKATLSTEDRIALTISPYVSSMADIVTHHHQRYPNLRYVPQDLKTLGTLLYGDAAEHRGKQSDIPVHTSHPLFVEDKVRMFIDPSTWMEYLSGFDFAFGTRIHGTITALLAGTPGYL
ncbi:polysaccharide pyruvyl transferase family protein, partial [Micromonospora sp. NPDC006766]|uniref:polysaccharide pyruvyl transferase family protein n=1 Tax=Micromonospora sp. NPDC006766 TaxID=3154778 RepID=UPI0033F3879E